MITILHAPINLMVAALHLHYTVIDLLVRMPYLLLVTVGLVWAIFKAPELIYYFRRRRGQRG